MLWSAFEQEIEVGMAAIEECRDLLSPVGPPTQRWKSSPGRDRELFTDLEVVVKGLRAVQLARGRGRVLLSLKPAPRIWDTAPASVILSAIGGSYTDLGGRTLVYYPDRLVHRDGAVGTLGIDHGEVLRCLGNWETTPVSRSVETAVDG